VDIIPALAQSPGGHCSQRLWGPRTIWGTRGWRDRPPWPPEPWVSASSLARMSQDHQRCNWPPCEPQGSHPWDPWAFSLHQPSWSSWEPHLWNLKVDHSLGSCASLMGERCEFDLGSLQILPVWAGTPYGVEADPPHQRNKPLFSSCCGPWTS
jgi:hypothetical protein